MANVSASSNAFSGTKYVLVIAAAADDASVDLVGAIRIRFMLVVVVVAAFTPSWPRSLSSSSSSGAIVCSVQ